jgi:spore maturation protein CgeB
MRYKRKILVVAKPWHGGLHFYYSNSFKKNKFVDVKFIPTYPNNYRDYFLYKLNKKLWLEKLVSKINSENYDLGFFINYLNIFQDLRNLNKNILYLTDEPKINVNQQSNFRNIYLSDIGYENKLISKKNYAGELPFAFDKNYHHEEKNNQKSKLICCIANKDNNRNSWFKLMYKEDSMPDIYGNYFLNSRIFFLKPSKFFPSIDFKNQRYIYSKYNVSLNIHASILKNGTNQRTFEAAGCSIAQLVNYIPGVDRFFEPDKEILLFSSIEEYKNKLSLLIKDKKLRDKLRQNALKRALSKHTYDIRVNKILRDF